MTISFRELSEKFLASVKIHQAERTWEYYEGYIRKFIEHLGEKAENPAEDMKPYQVNEWTDSHPKWSDNYTHGAVVAINTAYNWSVKAGYIKENPIKTATRPPAQSRKTFAKKEDFERILGCIKKDDPFYQWVLFAWHSGARPQEVRHIEPRHVDLLNKRIVFPAKESKGKRYSRRILLNDVTLGILTELMNKYQEGKLFRDSKGQGWTKFAICSRFDRISKITGKKLTAYDLRHGYATRKLKAGHGHIQIAATMGHRDGSMLARVYSHVHEDEDHLRSVLED